MSEPRMTQEQMDEQIGYFGPPTMRREWETPVPTPVGAVCQWCSEPVADGDIGTINRFGIVSHYECSYRAAVGSVGHIRRRCSCYGGDEDDPPGMTLRQAAAAALAEPGAWDTL